MDKLNKYYSLERNVVEIRMGKTAPHLLNLAVRMILTKVSVFMVGAVKMVPFGVSRFLCEVGVGSEMRAWGLEESEEALKWILWTVTRSSLGPCEKVAAMVFLRLETIPLSGRQPE